MSHDQTASSASTPPADACHSGVTRRTFLAGATAAVAASALISPALARQPANPTPPAASAAASTYFKLPPLTYAFDALEPHIDTLTMQTHHGKHHAAFIANLNKLVPANPVLTEHTVEQLLASNCAAVPEAIRTAVRNNAGGHHNHSLFWEILSPNDKPAGPTGPLADAISSTLGGYDKLKADLSAASLSRFGSGWGWLVVKDGKLAILSTPNQDSPLMDGATPILGLDVWEHAYYLKYQNRRADYIAAFWNVLNWRVVGEKYAAAVKG